jgi:hypothetical protein
LGFWLGFRCWGSTEGVSLLSRLQVRTMMFRTNLQSCSRLSRSSRLTSVFGVAEVVLTGCCLASCGRKLRLACVFQQELARARQGECSVVGGSYGSLSCKIYKKRESLTLTPFLKHFLNFTIVKPQMTVHIICKNLKIPSFFKVFNFET